ncbi:hypothetical protein Ddye_025881 [Dipteronia dyeriana]|uniref:RIN4 pathogenic type III effector avirulence factor Avr cleavage site domain-containing protein n=1 Tax=Dipteronia dyeriana TaxID=168575 RepID=A0AAD9WNY4_9ROSI|nr:hypothetical protein Ddye_025881 [Dipteronia dyeriana]
MDYDYCKKSGQIPAFGDWDYSNEMPITQYFECARQAGLIRYSSSSGDSDPYINGGAADDLYAVDLKRPSRSINNAPRKTRVRNVKRGSQVKEQKKQAARGKVFDVTEPPRKQPHHVPLSTNNINYNFNYNYKNNKKLQRDGIVPPPTTRRRPLSVRPPKAVDEDLYKIPPELLQSSNRKKMLGFFSCLVPACAS